MKSRRLMRGAEQPRDQPQARVLRAQVEQPLLGVEPEVDGRRHLVGASSRASSLGVGRAVGRLLDELGVGVVRAASAARRRAASSRSLEELDRRRPGRGGRPARSTMRNGRVPRVRMFIRPSSMRSSTSVISHAQPIGAQPVVGQPDDPELALRARGTRRSSSCSAPRRCAAGRPRRQRDEPEREEREVAHEPSAMAPSLRAGRLADAAVLRLRALDRDRLVPARPARPRPSRRCVDGASREHDRVVPLFVLDDALLDGPLPLAAPRTRVHARLPARARRRAARARRRRSSSATGGPRRCVPDAGARVRRARPCYWTSDVSPYARARDRRVTEALRRGRRRGAPAPGQLRRRRRRGRARSAGAPYTVFSPFSPRLAAARRAATVHRAPRELPRCPAGLRARPPAGARRRSATSSRDAVRSRARRRRARRSSAGSRGRSTDYARAPRPPRRRHVAAVALPALGLPLGARARGARAAPRRRRRRGVRAPARLARLLRPRAAAPPGNVRARVPGALPRRSSGTTTPSCSRPGSEGRTGYPLVDAGDAPARARRAGCTTARGWSSARS